MNENEYRRYMVEIEYKKQGNRELLLKYMGEMIKPLKTFLLLFASLVLSLNFLALILFIYLIESYVERF